MALAHRRRKSIHPSSAGDEVDGRCTRLGLTIVFNDCIYNRRELCRELERAGHRFASTSDSEVIPTAHARCGSSLRRELYFAPLPALLSGAGVDTELDAVALHRYLSWHTVLPGPRAIISVTHGPLAGRAQAVAGDRRG